MGHRSSWMLVLLLLFAAPVRAEDWGRGELAEDDELSPPEPEPPPPPRSFTERPVHLMTTVGVGTLVGFFGLTAGYNVHDRLELGAGIGLNGHGAMGGPYVRFRPLVRTRQKSRTLHAFVADLGLSVGGYSFRQTFAGAALAHSPADEHPYYHTDLALFLQTELSWEMVKLEGFSLRAGGGGTTLLNPGGVECEEPTSETAYEYCSEPPRFFPVLLFQVGMAF